MSKPPRRQSPRSGRPQGPRDAVDERSNGRGTTKHRDTRDRSSGKSETGSADKRDKEPSILPPKKPGWARAAPPKKTPWRAKSRKAQAANNTDTQESSSREQGRSERSPRRGSTRREGDPPANDAAQRPSQKKVRRPRPVAGRGHIERPDNRMRRGERHFADRDGNPHKTRAQQNTSGDNHADRVPFRDHPGNKPDRPGRAAALGDGAPAEDMRIAKAMARSGLCSRRDAERWIEEGRVVVNGEAIASPALVVGPKDRVLVDGHPLPFVVPTQLWRYSKPRGVVTTHRDPEGRPTVFEDLPADMPRVLSIGRLDYNTEGLLLLTTDGALARYLELPSTGWLRRYRVRAHGRITQADLDALKDGHDVDGIQYGPIEATLDSVQGTNVWLTLGLREGKNREVRNILGSLGLEVNRLIRVSFGPFQLLDMKPGSVELVRRKVLIDQLGGKLADEFNLASEEVEIDGAPVRARRPDKPTDKRAPHSRDGHQGKSRTVAKPSRRTVEPGEASQQDWADDVPLDDIKPWDTKPASDAGDRQRKARRSRRTGPEHQSVSEKPKK